MNRTIFKIGDVVTDGWMFRAIGNEGSSKYIKLPRFCVVVGIRPNTLDVLLRTDGVKDFACEYYNIELVQRFDNPNLTDDELIQIAEVFIKFKHHEQGI